MKQFFRAEVGDPACRTFLKSRGAVLPQNLMEKLIRFLYTVSPSPKHARQMLTFAVKNVRAVVTEEGREAGGQAAVWESEALQSMQALQPAFLQFTADCSVLGWSAATCWPGLLPPLLARAAQRCTTQQARRQLCHWVLQQHNRLDKQSVPHLLDITQSHSAETFLQGKCLKCRDCEEETADLVGLLLHAGRAHPTSWVVECEVCRSEAGRGGAGQHLLAVLQLHLASHAHLANTAGAGLEKMQVVMGRCDPCQVEVGLGEEVDHCTTPHHTALYAVLSEYTQYCAARQISPVDHSNFPDFIFFLRCIHSLSSNLNIPMRTIMDLLSKVHKNFDSLINVNESSDVKEEVIEKLSSTEPAVFFCYSCCESFSSCGVAVEHLPCSQSALGIRCIVCRCYVSAASLTEHTHPITQKQLVMVETAVEVLQVVDNSIVTNDEPKTTSMTTSTPDVTSVPKCETIKTDKDVKAKRKEITRKPLDLIPVNENMKFHIFQSVNKIKEDFKEDITFDSTINEILASQVKCLQPSASRSKTIVEHCNEKRKSDVEDSTTSPKKKTKLDSEVLEITKITKNTHDECLVESNYSKMSALKTECEKLLKEDCEEDNKEDKEKHQTDGDESEYDEDSDDELELIEESVIEIKEKQNVTNIVKMEPTAVNHDFKPFSTSLQTFPPNISLDEKLEKTKELLGIEIIELKSQKTADKQEIEKQFEPINCDVTISDVSKNPEWSSVLDSQIQHWRQLCRNGLLDE